MKKTSLFITIAFCLAIGFLIARLTSPTPTLAPAKVEKPGVVVPTPKPAPVVAAKPAAPTQAKRPEMDEATKARFKAFGEETKKMALDLAGGDEKKLTQAFRNGMTNPASQDVFKRGREIGDAFRAAQTDAEREALMADVQSLREQGLGILKAELDKLDTAPAATPVVPAPVIPTQGLM
jgi:hypothetical protein